MNDAPKTEAELRDALLRAEIATLESKVDQLSADVQGLVEAWRTASGIVAFVKWVAGFVTACGILWAAFRLKFGV